MASITAIVLTRNEEKNLPACLDSIRGFVERAVVVDCFSSDRTVEIAHELGADVIEHAFSYYAQQFNWAIDNAGITSDWILRLDADERLTPALIAEAQAIIDSDAARSGKITGIVMEAEYYFLGRAIRHGLRKKCKLMFFRRGIGRIEDRRRDAHSIISSGESVKLKQRFLHYDFKDLSNYIRRYEWYATREMQDYFDYVNGAGTRVESGREIAARRKKKFGLYYKAPRYLRCKLWFIYNYYFRLGFLDGREGYLYHYFECEWYRMLVDAKIFEQEKTGRAPEVLKPLD